MSPGVPEPTVRGAALSLADTKLREASAEMLIKREERGRDTTTALIGQVATIGTFLGAFGLLNDAAKSALVQSNYTLYALIAAAVSLGFSLSTNFLLPARMPSLDKPDELRVFWNDRVRARRALLVGALVALGVGIFFASKAFAEASDAVAATPAAAVSGKFTPSKDTAGSLEATATWQGLEPGQSAVLCVFGPSKALLGGGIGDVGSDGAQTITMTVPVPAGTTGEVTLATAEMVSPAGPDATPTAFCDQDLPARVSSIITVG